MREAVKIVIDRMESHPEDFGPHGKFGWFFNEPYAQKEGRFFTDEEWEALKQAHKGLMYRWFSDRVMKSLLDDRSQEWHQEMQAKAYLAGVGTQKLAAAQGFNGTFTFTDPYPIPRQVV